MDGALEAGDAGDAGDAAAADDDPDAAAADDEPDEAELDAAEDFPEAGIPSSRRTPAIRASSKAKVSSPSDSSTAAR